MRTLILLRGIPNTTQKQFIEKNKLQDYYIDVKEISKLVQSPALNGEGEFFYKTLSHRNLFYFKNIRTTNDEWGYDCFG